MNNIYKIRYWLLACLLGCYTFIAWIYLVSVAPLWALGTVIAGLVLMCPWEDWL